MAYLFYGNLLRYFRKISCKSVEHIVLILLATITIGNLSLLIFDYNNLAVFGQVVYDHIPHFTIDGTAFKWNDFQKALSIMSSVGEDRPRYLTWLIHLFDIKFQFLLYKHFLPPPTLSLTWIFTLLIAPIYLYKLLWKITISKEASLAGVIIYISSIGFLSSFSWFFLPGKPLTHVVFIFVFYCMVVIQQNHTDRQLLFEVNSKYRVIMYIVIFLSLFLDEIPLFLIFILPIMFINLFYRSPSYGKKDIYPIVINFLHFSLPFLIFFVVAILVMPRITSYFVGKDFDFLSLVFQASETTNKHIIGSGFQITHFYQNFANLFGMEMIPTVLAPIKPTAGVLGENIFLQENNLLKNLIFLAIFSPISIYVLLIRNFLILRLIIATSVFIALQTLLQSRHVRVVSSFYYGSCFSVLFAILAGSIYSIKNEKYEKTFRIVKVVLLSCMIVVQINNFKTQNKIVMFYTAEWMKREYESSRPKFAYSSRVVHQPLTRVGLKQLYNSWRESSLKDYLKQNGVSREDIYILFYLKSIDEQKSLRSEM